MHFVLNAIGTVKQKSVHLLFICLGVGLFVGNKACSFVLPQMSVLVGGLRHSYRILFQQASGVVTRMQAGGLFFSPSVCEPFPDVRHVFSARAAATAVAVTAASLHELGQVKNRIVSASKCTKIIWWSGCARARWGSLHVALPLASWIWWEERKGRRREGWGDRPHSDF